MQREIIKMLTFADNIVLLADSEEDLGNIMKEIGTLLGEVFELKINKCRTNVRKYYSNIIAIRMEIQVGDDRVETGISFYCLGRKLTQDGKSRKNIKRRIVML